MEFADLVRQRRMTRSFRADPVDPSLLRDVLDAARRVPSAGNTQGFDIVVLEGAATARYWDVTLPRSRRDSFRFPTLVTAPVIVTIWADPAAYVRRYGERDKMRTGLGEGADRWATPYWTVDASFAALALQYAAIDAGLGVLFFGMFDHADAVARELGVPADRVPIGTIAIGWPDDAADEAAPGRSADRRRRTFESQVHFGGW